MIRLMRSPFGHRFLPPLVLFALIGGVYWLYSLHPTRARDPQDTRLSLFLSVVFLIGVVIMLARNRQWPVRLLGILGIMLGSGVLYGSIASSRLGWSILSAEQRFDLLRASLTVGGVLFVAGLVWLEIVERRHPGDPHASENGSPEALHFDRRVGPADRRAYRPPPARTSD